MVWEGLVATKVVLGAAQHGDGVVVDVGGDSGVSGRPPDGEHSEFRVKDHPGGRVDLGQFGAGPFPVLFYVLPVGLGVSLKDLSGGADHGDALGADHMVGSKWALAGQRGQVGSGQECRHRQVGMPAHHHGFPGHPGEVTAQSGQIGEEHLGQFGTHRRGDRCFPVQPRHGTLDEVGMTSVGGLRVLAEGEQSVVTQDHAKRALVGLLGPG